MTYPNKTARAYLAQCEYAHGTPTYKHLAALDHYRRKRLADSGFVGPNTTYAQLLRMRARGEYTVQGERDGLSYEGARTGRWSSNGNTEQTEDTHPRTETPRGTGRVGDDRQPPHTPGGTHPDQAE